MDIKKYAAIDIGSNAIRLLVANVISKDNFPTQYRKSSLVRVPIRLGADAFTTGIISKNNINRITDAMQAFKLLMSVHGVEKFKACATSAMREASNGKMIIETVLKKTGIKIDVIDGKTEAAIISATDLNEIILGDDPYLYVDVGGGSTEFTFFDKGKMVTSRSFKLGTVR
ncbi:MAG: exopolyphosphatase, partial [Aureibaculum sp.]